MIRYSATGFSLLLVTAGAVRASEPPATTPLPTPLTRPEMKQALENLKKRTPRIPLPPLTDADRAKLRDRADSYEARLRYHYLPGGDTQASGFRSREPDPNMTLSYAFKTKLFWIVSRTNNCLY